MLGEAASGGFQPDIILSRNLFLLILLLVPRHWLIRVLGLRCPLLPSWGLQAAVIMVNGTDRTSTPRPFGCPEDKTTKPLRPFGNPFHSPLNSQKETVKNQGTHIQRGANVACLRPAALQPITATVTSGSLSLVKKIEEFTSKLTWHSICSVSKSEKNDMV